MSKSHSQRPSKVSSRNSLNQPKLDTKTALDKFSKGFISYFNSRHVDEEDVLDTIISILQKHPDHRNKDDLQTLIPLLREIKFFKERDIKEDGLMNICHGLQYQHRNEGEAVFNFGSYGDTLYIILEGSVSVLIPTEPQQAEEDKKEKEKKEKEREREKNNESQVKSNQGDESKDEKTQKQNEKTKDKDKDKKEEKNNENTLKVKESGITHKNNKSFIPEEDYEDSQDEDEENKQLENKSNDSFIQNEETNLFFIEVAVLHKGSSFGELALIQNITRTATIKCKEECHFATMNRETYERELKKIDTKKLNEIIDFFISLPVFKHWSRRALAKLKYFFNQKSFSRGQTVYKGGDNPSHIYVVKSGEFEVSYKIEKLEKKEVKVVNYLGPQHVRNKVKELNERVISSNRTSLQSKVVKNVDHMQLVILGEGQMFGEDDAILQRKHQSTVTCISFSGEVFYIRVNEFFRRIKINEESWEKILKSIYEKQLKLSQRLKERDIRNSKTFPQLNYYQKLLKNLDKMSEYPFTKFFNNASFNLNWNDSFQKVDFEAEDNEQNSKSLSPNKKNTKQNDQLSTYRGSDIGHNSHKSLPQRRDYRDEMTAIYLSFSKDTDLNRRSFLFGKKLTKSGQKEDRSMAVRKKRGERNETPEPIRSQQNIKEKNAEKDILHNLITKSPLTNDLAEIITSASPQISRNLNKDQQLSYSAKDVERTIPSLSKRRLEKIPFLSKLPPGQVVTLPAMGQQDLVRASYPKFSPGFRNKDSEHNLKDIRAKPFVNEEDHLPSKRERNEIMKKKGSKSAMQSREGFRINQAGNRFNTPILRNTFMNQQLISSEGKSSSRMRFMRNDRLHYISCDSAGQDMSSDSKFRRSYMNCKSTNKKNHYMSQAYTLKQGVNTKFNFIQAKGVKIAFL